DPDPDDIVTYTMYFETPDTLISYGTNLDTCISINVGALGLSDSVIVEWWVEAHSICPDTIIESLSRFHFYPPSEHPPSAFNLISPAWGDTCWTLDTLLVWEEALDSDSGDTVHYEIFLDTLSELSTAWEVAFGLSDTSFALDRLLDDHSYYWTVHATDLNTSGTWANDTLMFRTYYPEAPSEFVLLEPEDNSLLPFGDVDFCWQTSQEPDPGDIVTYTMYFQSSDTSLTIIIGTDTCHTLDVGGLELTDSLVVEWWIEAHSTFPDITIECTSRFHFHPPSATENEHALIPDEFALHQNWPNPFNPTTQISFDLKETGFVNLKIYNIMGQEITSLVNSIKTAGTHTITFNANNLPSGIYLYRLEVNDFVSHKKMLLLK
ncbi:T9SS type A sorting domain-containing protein, partial [bacterium]|nr:T9SS type A sorting domain-containing protein [bacterium]